MHLAWLARIVMMTIITVIIVCRITSLLQVYHVRNKMDETGLDMLLDIHGDEELPYNFINGNEVTFPHACR